MTQDVDQLVRAAARGERESWEALVGRYTNLLWSIARAHRLSTADAADVVQTTWLRFVEHLDSIQDPARAGSWLATTARRECLRTIRRRARSVSVDDERFFEPLGTATDLPGDQLLLGERDAQLWRAVDQLDSHCRQLLRVLMTDPKPAYEEVSAALNMPVGSIGPTRGRCLEKLRKLVTRVGISNDSTGSIV